MTITRPLHAFAVAVFALAVLAGPLSAAELPKPAETVVLTIGGAVKYANRGVPDHFAASFLKTQEYDYTKAAAFDVPMLEGLGMEKATINAAPWPRAVTLEGPRLVDVLMAAGWNGTKITMVALDGFAVEVSAADIAAREWIVGIKADGAYLPIGGRGPVWIAYHVPGGEGTEEDEARWPWAVYYIAAE